MGVGDYVVEENQGAMSSQSSGIPSAWAKAFTHCSMRATVSSSQRGPAEDGPHFLLRNRRHLAQVQMGAGKVIEHEQLLPFLFHGQRLPLSALHAFNRFPAFTVGFEV